MARARAMTATSSPTIPQPFAKAIEACHASGGGRVVVPPGVWKTGAIHLKSNVNLHLAEGATLKFSSDPEKYLPPCLHAL